MSFYKKNTRDFSVPGYRIFIGLFDGLEGFDHVDIVESLAHYEAYYYGEEHRHEEYHEEAVGLEVVTEHYVILLDSIHYEPVEEYAGNKSDESADSGKDEVFSVNVGVDFLIRKAENLERCDLSCTLGNVDVREVVENYEREECCADDDDVNDEVDGVDTVCHLVGIGRIEGGRTYLRIMHELGRERALEFACVSGKLY